MTTDDSGSFDFMTRPAAELGKAVVDYPGMYPLVDERLFRFPDGSRAESLICRCDGRKHIVARVHRDVTEDLLLVWTCGERGPLNEPGVVKTGPVQVKALPPIGLHLPATEQHPQALRHAACPRCRGTWFMAHRIGYVEVLSRSEAPGRGRVVP